MTKPFGEDLWKNVQAVKVTRDGGIEVPVQADGNGIGVGLDAIAAERVRRVPTPAEPAEPR